MKQRPLIVMLFGLVLGEVFVQTMEKSWVWVVFIGILAIGIIGYFVKMDLEYKRLWFLLLFFVGLGAVRILMIPTHSVLNQWADKQEQVTIQGYLSEIVTKEEGVTLYIKAQKITTREKTVKTHVTIVVYGLSECQAKLGDTYEVKGKLTSLKAPSNPGEFNQERYLRGENVSYICFGTGGRKLEDTTFYIKEQLQNIRGKISSVYRKDLPKKKAGILCAMVLGEKRYLEEEMKLLYQQNQIAHVLAISGLHMGIVGMGLFRLRRKQGASYLEAFVQAGVVILGYGILTGLSDSTLRAMLMLVVFMLGEYLGRSYDLLSAMALSAMILLLQNPNRIYSSGVLLSYGAIVSIGLYQELKKSRKEKEKEEKNWFGKLKDSFFVVLWIQLFTLPILIQSFHMISPYSIFLNLIIVPLLSILFPLALLGGILGCVFGGVGKVCLQGAGLILDFYELLARVIRKLPFSTVPISHLSMLKIVIYYTVVLIAVVLLYKNKQKIIAYACFVMAALVVLCHIPTDRVVFFDVGQGDGIYIESSDHTNYFIDGGSSQKKQVGKYILRQGVLYYGHNSIDYVFVTHADSDHISGIMELLEEQETTNFYIKNLVLPVTNLEDAAYKELVRTAKEHHTNLIYFESGNTIKGDITFSCLYPYEGLTVTNRNDYSMVLELEMEGLRGLFMGDLPQEGEEWLVKEGALKEYDFVKIGHHGSKYSSGEEFLNQIHAQLGFISVGVGNRYGHPHKETLTRLSKHNMQVYQTSKVGAIEVTTKRKRGKEYGIFLKCFKEK